MEQTESMYMRAFFENKMRCTVHLFDENSESPNFHLSDGELYDLASLCMQPIPLYLYNRQDGIILDIYLDMATGPVNYKSLLAQAAAAPAPLIPCPTRTLSRSTSKSTKRSAPARPEVKETFQPEQQHHASSENKSQEKQEPIVSQKRAVVEVPSGTNKPRPRRDSLPVTSVVRNLATSSTVKEFDGDCLRLMKRLPSRIPMDRWSNTSDARRRTSISNPAGLPFLYRSLCICDSKLRGSPIHLKSKYFSSGPRGLRVGQCEFANLSYDDRYGGFCEVTARPDLNGRPKFVLEYADRLVDSVTGAPVWILGAQMDITHIVHKLTRHARSERVESWASVSTAQSLEEEHLKSPLSRNFFLDFDTDSGLDTIVDEPPALDENESGPRSEASCMATYASHSLMFYDILQPDEDKLSVEIDESIDWIEAACSTPSIRISKCSDESDIDSMRSNSTPSPSSESSRDARSPQPSSVSSMISAPSDVSPEIASAFSDLIRDVNMLHRSFFVLSGSTDIDRRKSAFTAETWKIAFMSPYLYSRVEDRRAGLMHTPMATVEELGILLSGDKPVSLLINWGARGTSKRLYCSPMLKGGSLHCWLCFLIDPWVRTEGMIFGA